MVGALREFPVSPGRVAAVLTFSAISIAAMIGIAFLIRLSFPFLPNVAVGFGFLPALAISIYYCRPGRVDDLPAPSGNGEGITGAARQGPPSGGERAKILLDTPVALC